MSLKKTDRFILATILTVLTAWLFPQWGGKNSHIPLDSIGSIGISLIFFFYGLKLSFEKIKTGLRNWKLHLVVQLSTFLLFPLIVLFFFPFLKTEHSRLIWLAFLFLAALPSTVSSSVVMVSIAKGNLPAAIFNASISGLIGIAVTPLWTGFFLSHSAGGFDLSAIYLKLLTEIFLPISAGLALYPLFGKYVQRHSSSLVLFDKSVILLIIYKSFAASFEDQVFSSVGIKDLLFIFAAVAALFYIVYHLTGYGAQLLKFNREDRITAQFCGTKKSLVHGTVFSSILFPASIPAGIILLPLMVFHALQIFIITIVATKLGKQAAEEA